jgi:hypothetical protein
MENSLLSIDEAHFLSRGLGGERTPRHLRITNVLKHELAVFRFPIVDIKSVPYNKNGG